MKSIFRLPITVILFVVLTISPVVFLQAKEGSVVSQSQREIPVAYEVDLLVVGGTTGGVAAACEASRAGAKVLLVTPYPYLGEDRTATLRLWSEHGEDENDALAKILMNDPYKAEPLNPFIGSLYTRKDALKFSYNIKGEIDSAHGEIAAPGRLGDKRFFDSVNDSLQINGDAEIVVDLGETKSFCEIILLAFQRSGEPGPFKVDSVSLSYSKDKTDWKLLDGSLKIENQLDGVGKDKDSLLPFVYRTDPSIETRYLKFEIKKATDVKRMLLGELFLFSGKSTDLSNEKRNETKKLLRCPRPMHVKYVMDQSLLEAGVPFLLNTFDAGEIRDDIGNLRGITVTNRAGRQAIVAKKVVRASSLPMSLNKAEFVVIGGKPVSPELEKYPLLKNISHEIVGEPFISYTKGVLGQWGSVPSYDEYPIINYTFEINVPENTSIDDFGFRQEIETQIRLATFDKEQAFTADEIYFNRPFESLSVWRKRGKEAAVEALAMAKPELDKLNVSTTVKSDKPLQGDVREILAGVRPGLNSLSESLPRIRDTERKIPVLAEYDVVVVGGGTTGAPAGIAAGRHGAKTLVLEHLHDLGGIGTAGAISIYWYGNRVGFTKEVQDGRSFWGIEEKIHWWRKKLDEAGTDVWYGVLATGAWVDENRVEGVLVSTPCGTGIVKAKFVIDATGNADIAAATGVETQYVNEKEIAVQGAGLAPRNLGASYMNTDFMFVDETDLIDSVHAFVYAKEKFRSAFDLGKLLATRERRQIVGDFSFNVLDQVNHRTYPDSIVYAYSDYDTHGYTVDPYMELNHPYRDHHSAEDRANRPDLMRAYVPYRSSIPKGFDGLLVGGLATSCHRDALPIIRMQPDLQNQGYALGTATAMMVQDGITEVRKADVKKLQKHLIEIGNLDSAVSNHEDNYGKTRDRLSGMVDDLPEHFYESVSQVMWYPDVTKPLIHDACLKEKDPARKLVYAKVAAAMGDPVGIETLLDELKKYTKWDRGWDYKSMGQAGSATSPMDRLIMMIGWTKDPRAVAPIAEKMKTLDNNSAFSHHRAVILALENIGGTEASTALAEHLSKPGMTGYVHDSIEKAKRFDREAGLHNPHQEKARRDSLVEISLARALFHCGDRDGKGEAILKAYLRDLRGYFARHANEVLKNR